MTELESKFLKLPEAKMIAELKKLYPEFDKAAGKIKESAMFVGKFFCTRDTTYVDDTEFPFVCNMCNTFLKEKEGEGEAECQCSFWGIVYDGEGEDVEWDYSEWIRFKTSKVFIPTYSSDDLFAMLPEWTRDMVLDHISAMGYIRHLEIKDRARAYGHLRSIVFSGNFSWKALWYELILYLCNSGHYGGKVK